METNKIHSLLKQFNETIDKWITYLDDYRLEMLCQKPQMESWSLGQVYVHIIDDTNYFIEQMKVSLLSNNVNSEKEMHKDAKALFENNEFPDVLLDNPSNNLNLRQPKSKDELLQALMLIKDEVNELYSTSDVSMSNGKTEHPGLLFFNTIEWLQFAEMHMRHHLRQKKRIDDKLFFEK